MGVAVQCILNIMKGCGQSSTRSKWVLVHCSICKPAFSTVLSCEDGWKVQGNCQSWGLYGYFLVLLVVGTSRYFIDADTESWPVSFWRRVSRARKEIEAQTYIRANTVPHGDTSIKISLAPGFPPCENFNLLEWRGRAWYTFDHMLEVVGRLAISGQLCLYTMTTNTGYDSAVFMALLGNQP